MLREHGSTVLIVDDDSDMRLYCAKALESEGYATVLSGNGQAALEVLGRQPIGLLITDFQLAPSSLRLVGGPRRAPVLNGIGLVQRALASHPALRVIFISAHGEQVLATKGFDASKIPLLRKPFNAESLRRVVQDALQEGMTPVTRQVMPTPALIPRRHPRFQVAQAAVFSGGADGEGMVKNLSIGGCQIQSSCMVPLDTYLTLLITLPDARQPFKINVAVVRWARPGVFGLEFRHVERHIHERLAKYLSTLDR
jgi:CheY-like chemotaxis protein